MASHALLSGLKRVPCQTQERSPTPTGMLIHSLTHLRGAAKLSTKAFRVRTAGAGARRGAAHKCTQLRGSPRPCNFRCTTLYSRPARRAINTGGTKQQGRKYILMQLRERQTDTMDLQKSSSSSSQTRKQLSTGRHARQKESTQTAAEERKGLYFFSPSSPERGKPW